MVCFISKEEDFKPESNKITVLKGLHKEGELKNKAEPSTRRGCLTLVITCCITIVNFELLHSFPV